MVNIILSMILCILFTYHIFCGVSVTQIRKPQNCAPFLGINLSRSGTVCRFWLWRASLRVTGSATPVRLCHARHQLRDALLTMLYIFL
ncbi:hypothetical protein F3V92_23020 [Salmonella enterica]|nr:hypothetical protein [Salmonella enterica]